MTQILFPGWHLCPSCPPGDREWPTECFDLARGMCKACAHEQPRRVRRKCNCGRTVETLDRVKNPMCRPCRARAANLRIPHQRAKKRKYDRRRYQSEKRKRAA